MLCRYITRPAVAEERLELKPSGDVILQLKTPYTDGTTHLLFSGLEFVEKLAALIPPARVHLTRFFGCLAPHAKIREQIVPKSLPAPAADADTVDPQKKAPQRASGAKRWAELLARVFGLDMHKCVNCGGPLKIVSAILEPRAIQDILTHLSLPHKPPGLAPPRIPEQFQFS